MHLDRVAGGRGERLVHVGDQRRGLQAGAVGDRDQALGQRRANSARLAMKAPLPVLTSSTRPSRPAASFFDRIEAVISGIDSTVAVTSRMA